MYQPTLLQIVIINKRDSVILNQSPELCDRRRTSLTIVTIWRTNVQVPRDFCLHIDLGSHYVCITLLESNLCTEVRLQGRRIDRTPLNVDRRSWRSAISHSFVCKWFPTGHHRLVEPLAYWLPTRRLERRSRASLLTCMNNIVATRRTRVGVCSLVRHQAANDWRNSRAMRQSSSQIVTKMGNRGLSALVSISGNDFHKRRRVSGVHNMLTHCAAKSVIRDCDAIGTPPLSIERGTDLQIDWHSALHSALRK